MGFDWKGTLAQVAPMIGASLGGPLGATGVSVALKALGIAPASDPQDNETMLQEAIKTATPDQLLALKQADHQFKIDMRELDIDEKKLQLKDVANARQREVEVGGNTTPAMAWTIVLGGFSFLGFISYNQVVIDKVLLGTIIGMIISEIRQVTAYYYGSSSGQDFNSNKKS